MATVNWERIRPSGIQQVPGRLLGEARLVLGAATVAAAASGLFGLFGATLRALLLGNPSHILPTTGYFLLCGAAASTLVTLSARILTGNPDSETDHADG